MKCINAIAILRQKAEILDHIQYRISSLEEARADNEKKLMEYPEDEWRFSAIEEYKAQLEALQTIMQAVYKC